VLRRLWLALVVLVIGLATPTLAQDEVELKWNFSKDQKPFYQTLTSKTVQDMTVMGQPVKQEQTQEFVFSWTVKEASADKVVLEQKIEAVMMTIKIGSNEIKYDSRAKDAADNQLAAFFKPMLGATFTITLDPKTMKVTAVGGREEFVTNMAKANPSMGNLLKTILSDDQFRQMTEPAFAVLPPPGQKVKRGSQWTRESKLAMGPIGSYDAVYTFTYDGTEKRVIDGKDANYHKIKMEAKLTYKPPEGPSPAGLTFKIEGGTVTTKKAEGTIFFDAERGRVAEATMDVVLEGKLTVTVSEQKGEVTLNQTQNVRTTTSDRNPVEPPK
jgi:hypothetical protein